MRVYFAVPDLHKIVGCLAATALLFIGLFPAPPTRAEAIGSTTPRNGLPLIAGTSGGPVLYRLSETLSPGDTLNINGGNFTSSSVVVIQPVLSSGARGPSQAMTQRNASDFLIQADVPSSLSRGLWAVWVEQVVNGVRVASNERFVNQARVTNYLTGTIAPNETLEVMGRNLVQDPGNPLSYQSSEVRFVHGGTSLSAAITGGDEYLLTVTAPGGLVPGTSYDVYVSNGWGGSTGSTKAEPFYDLEVVAPGVADVFALGVPWARDYSFATDPGKQYNMQTDVRLLTHAVADGDTTKTDNFAAINSAINYAHNNGGGVLYFPAGTYHIDVQSVNKTLQLRRNVVLKGDGIGATIFTYGELGVAPQSSFMDLGGSTRSAFGSSGLYNLSIHNANANYTGWTSPVNQQRGINASLNSGKLFFKNVEYRMGPYDHFGISDAHELVIRDSTFISRYRHQMGVFSFYGDEGYQSAVPGTFNIIRGNSFTYLDGRMEMVNLLSSAVENNQVIRDMTARPNLQDENFCCSGGITSNYSHYSLFRGNTIDMVNETPGTRTGTNAGESFLTEIHTKLFSQMGTVTTASGASLTDSSKQWDTEDRWPTQLNRLSFGNPDCGGGVYTCNPIPSHIRKDGTVVPYDAPWNRRPVVAITSGRGMGQVRHIVGNTATSLTLDRAWDLPPEPGAQYKITYFNIEGQLVIDNEIASGGGNGIMIANGGYDSIVAENTLTNAGGIIVFGLDLNAGNWQKSCRFLGYRDYVNWTPREISSTHGHPEDNVPPELYTCYDQHLAWYIQVNDNSVTNSNGLYPAGIYVGSIQFLNAADTPSNSFTSRPVYHGNSMLSIELRRNAVSANPGPDSDFNYLSQLPTNTYRQLSWDFMGGEGYFVMNGGSAKGHAQDTGAANVTVGTILQDNTLANQDVAMDIHPYTFSNGVSQTTLRYASYSPGETCFALPLPTSDMTAQGITLQLFAPERVDNSWQKRDKPLVLRLESQRSNSTGKVSSYDPVADFLMRYRFQITTMNTAGVVWNRHHWVPVVQSTQDYDVWYKVPGFLGEKVADVAAEDLLDGNSCGDALSTSSPARVGDFNDDNTITEADLTQAIATYQGLDSNYQVKQAFAGNVTLAGLVTVVRGMLTDPAGEDDTL